MSERYPKHIEDLCQAILDGSKDAWGPLHDALIEAGWPRTAEYHCKNEICMMNPACCHPIRFAVGGYRPEDGLSASLIERAADHWLKGGR